MNIYISFSVLDSNKYSYSDLCIKSANSLIKTGFPEDRIICLVHKSIFEKIRSNLPKAIVKKIVDKVPNGLKGWFFKPIANYVFFKNTEISPPYLYAISDVDNIFLENPVKYLTHQKCDLLCRSRERFLRPSNLKRLNKKYPNYIKPTIESSFKELSVYMGRTRAYLFSKYKIKKIPDTGLYSDFVSIQHSVCRELIEKWYEMFLDISRFPEYCTGDQEILCSAIDFLGLSYECIDTNFVQHFQSGKKKKLL